ncbi:MULTISPECIES: DMT family transporter [Pseudoalteromonas]|uniref:DMT family transporter n=1 Tax=Pseudoalteromonas obscura TaxID=3048491 RepID=A0ABT7ELY9_9GAMM|nr:MULTISPECIES: DMT family transporter [Pseudoalteromonas]MBQ4838010.1 DMT family transporter [Pseudoalteromonas luteoviolacea]MDK2596042.1 DMT family transporter [Pseudoalteromonas sp. P94(2023)]
MNINTLFSNTQFLGLSTAILGILLMSFDPIFIRYAGVGGTDTVFLFGLFTAISMPVFLAITDKRGIYRAVKQSGWPLVVASLLMLLGSSTFVVSVKHTTIANTFLILATTPVISALFSWLILREKLNKDIWMPITLLLFGVIIVAKGSLSSLNWFGDAMALLSVTSLSLLFVLLRKYQQISKIAAVGLAGMLIALTMFYYADPASYTTNTWLIMAAMGLFTAPLGRVLSMMATTYISAAEVSMTLVLEAVFATFWAYLFFQEIPSLDSIFGGMIILLSLTIYIWRSIKSQKL